MWVLNEALTLEPETVKEIMKIRIPCGEGFRNHESILVRANPGGTVSVGVLGLINGLFGPQWPRIAAEYNGENELAGFSLITEKNKTWH